MQKIILPTVFFILIISSCSSNINSTIDTEKELTRQQRKENYEYFGEVFDKQYCFFEIKKIDWEILYNKYLPLIKNCQTDKVFFLLLEMVAAELQDEHIWIDNPTPNIYSERGVDFDVDYIEGKCMVTFVHDTSQSYNLGLREGMEILTINNKTIPEIEKEIWYKIYDHKYSNRISSTIRYVFHKNDLFDSLNVKFRNNNNKSFDILLPLEKRKFQPWYTKFAETYLDSIKFMQYVKHGVIQDRIGYIRISKWVWEGGWWNFIKLKVLRHPTGIVVTEFNKALEELKNTRGLIIDLRGNPGGGDPPAQYVASRFLTRKTLEGYYNYRDGDFKGMEEIWNKPGGEWQYTKPVILLTDSRNLSTSESFIATMKEMNHITVIGDTTNGTTGPPQSYKLPCGVKFQVTNAVYYLPDGTIPEWKGIPPDITIRQTIKDIKYKRDTVLEYAIRYLEDKLR